MHNQVKVEFRHRTIPATDDTIARRADAVHRLDELGHIDAAAGDLNTTETQWYAHFNTTELLVLDFSVQKLATGEVAVSLVALVDAVSIGDIPATAEPDELTDADRAEDDRQRLAIDRLTFAEQVTTALAAHQASATLAVPTDAVSDGWSPASVPAPTSRPTVAARTTQVTG